MATVRALKECYCGTPIAFRTPESEPFEYVGPKASYLELLDGEGTSTAARPQLDHDRDGAEGGAAPPADARPRPNRSTDPEREAVKKALKDAKIKFFGGASTEDLKKLLPA